MLNFLLHEKMFQHYQQRSTLHVAFQSIYVYQLVEACVTLEDSVSCYMLEIIPLKPLLRTISPKKIIISLLLRSIIVQITAKCFKNQRN